MKALLSVLLLAALVLPAEARLGESLKDLKRRYGQPMDAGNLKEANTARYTFNWDQYVVTVTVEDGLSVAEEFVRRNNRDFTLEEVRRLLAESSPGLAWTQVDGSTWKQKDRVATWTGRSLVVQESQRAR